MLPVLRRRFDVLEEQRSTLLAELATRTPAELERHPAAGGWSTLDVIEHLVRAEEGSMRQLEKRDVRRIGLLARARTAVLFRVMKVVLGRIRVRAPLPALLPSGDPMSLEDLARRWGEARCRLAGYLDALAPEQLGGRVFRHPIAGYFTMVQGLEFHQRHIAAHIGQIERIRATEFPARRR